jgi:excisionase family DNA binding protein
MPTAISLISTADVSSMLGVSDQTVRTWCRLGIIPATRPTGTRKWHIVESDFMNWLQDGAGAQVTAFLDPAHRSTASEAELLEDATAALDRIGSTASPSESRGSRSTTRRLTTRTA